MLSNYLHQQHVPVNCCIIIYTQWEFVYLLPSQAVHPFLWKRIITTGTTHRSRDRSHKIWDLFPQPKQEDIYCIYTTQLWSGGKWCRHRRKNALWSPIQLTTGAIWRLKTHLVGPLFVRRNVKISEVYRYKKLIC